MHARRLYAHRGASAERPENTMPAFERAVECGVDALEMDVQITRDGILIVAHDDSALRTTGASLAWADLDLREAQNLDAGWGFLGKDGTRPFAGKGIAVSTFESVLEAFPTMLVNVDLKGERSVDAMLALVARMNAADRVTLASFQLRTLLEVRKRGYPGKTGMSLPEVGSLLALPAVAWRQLPRTGDCAQVPVVQAGFRFDRPAFIAKCHSVGVRLDYWVIDDVAEAKRLLDLGADGIMTNDPALLRPLFT